MSGRAYGAPGFESHLHLPCPGSARGEHEHSWKFNGGEGGIRTHGPLARSTVFETAPFDHSGTSPLFDLSREPLVAGRQPGGDKLRPYKDVVGPTQLGRARRCEGFAVRTPDEIRRPTAQNPPEPPAASASEQMAEREGFEPSVELPLHTISSRAPSATRSPLRRTAGRSADGCRVTSDGLL